ncbi:hypothetical protein Bra3105_02485 [Brachybacterium halotolerans subsp. kimchii]|uniref:maltokinase N-terminal cap-like domain-containing protein n=1 Tax=Brachybacterium halotolerans TaxID=2795215 RepID=UPI001E3C552B|nr:hypothetical protein [Brachybacterium halotolerans]UEJ83215.1 hypothetical protein Bra3105_02485 [Brachybacterium halotolerans subsp. kimchii]
MAIIHRAQLTPSKTEILRDLLASLGWLEGEDLTVIGAYRFDDPAGQVGIECHLVRTGETVYHLPLTYRSAPIDTFGDDGEAAEPVATMEHSVLGTRFVFDALDDEVALDAFWRALCGEQQQAELDVYEGDRLVEHRAQSVDLRLEIDAGAQVPRLGQLEDDGASFTIAQSIGGLDGAVRLVADWGEGGGVIAAYDGD